MRIKKIEWANNNYLIYENGKVFSLKSNKELKHQKYGNGYVSVSLSINGKSRHYGIHRILAIAFLPNPENKKLVNHKNGIKTDNRIENLEWTTYSENNKHAFSTGLNSAKKGSDRHTSIINEKTVFLIRKLYKNNSVISIVRKLNLTYDIVWQVCKRKTWKHI